MPKCSRLGKESRGGFQLASIAQSHDVDILCVLAEKDYFDDNQSCAHECHWKQVEKNHRNMVDRCR